MELGTARSVLNLAGNRTNCRGAIVRRSKPLSNGAVIGWGALGLVAGLVAGTALGAWAGGVNRERVRRATRRLTVPAPAGPRTAAAAARDAQQSLDAEPALAGLGLEAVPAGPGA